jgi:polyhydroxyalkanoate synthase
MADGNSGAQSGRTALDVLLTDAAVGQRSRFMRPVATARVTAGLVRHPQRSARRVGGLGAELVRVAAGRSDRRPAKGDRRLADPAWESSWAFQRVMQTYLSIGEAVDGLVADAEVDWRAERQARFAAGNVVDALAPTNFPWSNPTVLKATIDQGGANFVRGAHHFLSDISRPPRLPAIVDTSKFSVGENLALTPGAVVLRTEAFELIHYAPRAEQVRALPLLFVPPTINNYYILDLAPGRSMIEHLLAEGLQCFPSPGSTRARTRGTSTSTRTRAPCSRRVMRWPRSPGSRPFT